MGGSAVGIKLFGATIRLEEQQESEGEPEMKRPEEMIACPRCSSMETKFCYFNNYNVNQPRHFCKGCQRYWTAGGALRNVPVGAGRRRARPPCRDQLQGAFLYGAAGLAFWDNGVVEDWYDFPVKRRRTNSGGQESSS